MYRMNAVIGRGGGGVGVESSVPGMLATFVKGEKWVTFDKTKGIMGLSRFKVMGLVDTLRNAKKFAQNGGAAVHR